MTAEIFRLLAKWQQNTMRWLRLVSSLQSKVYFAEYRLFYRALLQKRPMMLRSLLIVATLYLIRNLLESDLKIQCHVLAHVTYVFSGTVSSGRSPKESSLCSALLLFCVGSFKLNLCPSFLCLTLNFAGSVKFDSCHLFNWFNFEICGLFQIHFRSLNQVYIFNFEVCGLCQVHFVSLIYWFYFEVCGLFQVHFMSSIYVFNFEFGVLFQVHFMFTSYYVLIDLFPKFVGSFALTTWTTTWKRTCTRTFSLPFLGSETPLNHSEPKRLSRTVARLLSLCAASRMWVRHQSVDVKDFY